MKQNPIYMFTATASGGERLLFSHFATEPIWRR